MWVDPLDNPSVISSQIALSKWGGICILLQLRQKLLFFLNSGFQKGSTDLFLIHVEALMLPAMTYICGPTPGQS